MVESNMAHSDNIDEDTHLMLAFKAGDTGSFEKLFSRNKRRLVAFAARFTAHQHEAEELAQEVFVKCYLAAETYEPKAKFSTWLFRIARNHCLNELRRPARRFKKEPFEEDGSATPEGASCDNPEALAAAHALSRALQRELAALPENQRSALLLCRQHGLRYDEIADVLGTSVSAVKSLINRARKRLAEKLAPYTELRDAM
jgi:RNA polymerase sigma-70 factor (ECF subfamily)